MLFFRITSVSQLALLGVSKLALGPTQRLAAANDEKIQSAPSSFDWNTITASPEIVWHPCYGDQQCALLLVPLDWTHPTTSPRLSLAITSLPAQVPTTSPSYAGPLLVNPGGPGASGVEFFQAYGRSMRDQVGPNHTLISFDPRGVGNTSPSATCFPSTAAMQAWEAEAPLTLNNQTIPTEFARFESLWEYCEHPIQNYVSTPNVARDMLAIHEAAWRAAGRPKEAKSRGLRYWGLSYGSVLGMTFAQLYPKRSERLILDGIVDVEDFYLSLWQKNLQDADAVLDKFFEHCFTAGPRLCPFAVNATSVSKLKVRWDTLLEKLQAHPLPLVDTPFPGIVTREDVEYITISALYFPLDMWPSLGQALGDLIAGNGTLAYKLAHPPTDPTRPNRPGIESIHAIHCADAEENRPPLTIADMKSHLAVLKNQTDYFGPYWATIRIGCAGWKKKNLGVQAPRRWGGKMKHPMLFVGNELDPVTPVRNARRLRKLWKGSGLVVVKGLGHTTIATVGECFERRLRRYLRDGKVGGKEVMCGVDVKPFQGVGTMG